jgi:tetratricopeptide (TPR) repeat protein
MSSWDWFRYTLLHNWFFWWIAIVVLWAVAQPFVARVRLWLAKRRFIEVEGAKLLNPQNADARFQLANIYAEGRSWRRALEYASEAVRVATENPLYEGKIPYHFHRLLGDCLYRRGRLGEAVDAFRLALAAASQLGHGDARFGLGRTLLAKGEPAAAIDVLRESVRDNGSNLEAYFRWAQAAALLGNAEELEAARREFCAVARSLPRFARQKRLRWRLAFLFFPITRHLA